MNSCKNLCMKSIWMCTFFHKNFESIFKDIPIEMVLFHIQFNKIIIATTLSRALLIRIVQ